MTFRQFAYRNVLRNRRVYAAFFMASVFSVMVFFLYSMLLFHPSIENTFLQEISSLGMGIAEVILFIFTLFFLFYSMRSFLQARSREFGVLLLLGMARRQLHRLIFIETMLLGFASIITGIFIGFMFSKFFFMIVKAIVQIPVLPLYLSWKPFALTIGAFLSLFAIISYIAPVFIQQGKISDLLHGDMAVESVYTYSKSRGIFGVSLLLLAYIMATFVSRSSIISLFFLLPPLITFGTYYFFTDTLPLILHALRRQKQFFWRDYWMISISESIVRLKENARMFFIVTIVSTIAFMSVGILASLTSFASQYREVNPLGLVYKSFPHNEYEYRHIAQLTTELEQQDIDYWAVRFRVLQQQSSYTKNRVNIVKLADLNELAMSFGEKPLQLEQGHALFLPASASDASKLAKRFVHTELAESNMSLEIKGIYPYRLFPPNALGLNTIVVNHLDFDRVVEQSAQRSLAFTYYAFNIEKWQETKDIGLSINSQVLASIVLENKSPVRFEFENPGLNYSHIRMTFSLLLFIGLLLAGVFFLASGSFIYFRLYTSLSHDRKQYAVLQRIGMTDREFKKIVNRQLIPQFFFPWGVSFIHSVFAFLSLQVIWDALAEISIVKELTLVLLGFTVMQIFYFYLIRWRYISHIKAPTS
ncbi:ABC transporter permease [Sporosarcina sp. P13]|uniref:ABC transporter permease n=1 Tax=Sporosarcina sp. P13 TaxID=2048263 RepID=UPI000C16D606|nr:ABC transporter permease [Sporosarcina sp. P13]PIC64484.1 ABC transporter permease [Sporosarcina sp. P13]